MNPDETPPDYNQPVAYDANGQPLYAHPQVVDTNIKKPDPIQQVVHISRSTSPEKQPVSDATKLKNERSKQMFPDLNLTEHEYVISDVRRHMIGLVLPFSIGTIFVALGFGLLFNLDLFFTSTTSSAVDTSITALFVLLFIGLVIAGTYIAYYVYSSNRFYLTNESVIQVIQTGLFSKHEQAVSLANVEDSSFYQKTLFQQIFNYGTIRLSTQGDENTYRLTYVAAPREHIAALNNAVEAFKNGRPIGED